jgi:hypothetical protein
MLWQSKHPALPTTAVVSSARLTSRLHCTERRAAMPGTNSGDVILAVKTSAEGQRLYKNHDEQECDNNTSEY